MTLSLALIDRSQPVAYDCPMMNDSTLRFGW